MKRLDIVIAGGGLVGSATAIALAKRGMKVAVIEKAPRAQELEGAFDGRTSAIAQSSVRVFKHLGVWDRLVKEAEAILDIRVVDEHSTALVHYDHREIGKPFGYIFPNSALKPALLNAAEEEPGVEFYYGCQIADFAIDGFGVDVTLNSSEKLRASLLIAADGRFSETRRKLGIDERVYTYGQTAMVCTISHKEPHQGLALERFLPAGPFAVLPLKHKRSGVVWSEPEAMSKYLLSLPEETFLEELKLRLGDYLGEIELEGKCFSYPLGLVIAGAYISNRAVLVGDSAHAIHPIAGQGVNLGYRDVALLAEILGDAHGLGLDIGSATLLARYAQLRRKDVASMTFATDGLNRLFSSDNPLLRAARRIGLRGVENTPRLKRYFMLHAMGLTGELPDMLKETA